MKNISYSPLESARFGKNIHRGAMDSLDAIFLGDYIFSNDPDILIVRFPVAEQPDLYKLQNLGREIIFADTLVYYELEMEPQNIRALKNEDLNIVEATAADRPLLEKIIPEIFEGYTNHYFSNPLLDKDKIVEGYAEWAINYVEADQKLNLLAYKAETPVGFITCSDNGDWAEIILNGIMTNYRRGGIYTDMVRFVKKHFFEKGIRTIKVSTQIQNFDVQSVWKKESFYLKEAFITIHLNKKEIA
jgi:ribosomal protein S18 acetylase RimI-like enzyme